MKTLEKIQQIQSALNAEKKLQKSIGFVPTMGALHEGHLSLLRQAREENDVLVCSVFVNPIQFNNAEDLNNYPRNLDADLQKMQAEGCDYVFAPSTEEMYPEPVTDQYDFGNLERVMEGKFRPGHFNGVAIVVRKLFEIIQPDKAYFGKKDFQQLQIIRRLVDMISLDIDIVSVPISREPDGLARSSRNSRLTPEERKIAPNIYKIITAAKDNINQFQTPAEMKSWGLNELNKISRLQPEYFEIVDMDTLEPIEQWSDTNRCILCLAVFLGQVRLIDNIVLFS
ncbi:MAG: pantoate--beta-alanine ligase [Bacteroidales bacterium]|nr:pantoate--beta-alanine ligase [Bacteroidales bacterium]MCF8328246.1 pantoate--beta-alanine ligase [Bacteroidales bacterium]